MEDLDSLVGADGVLSRVTEFELDRPAKAGEGERITISVHEMLTGDHRGRFYAVPNLVIRESKEEYIGIGGSLEEALKNCLTKIKGIPIEDIIGMPE
jgi:hypothetical protein